MLQNVSESKNGLKGYVLGWCNIYNKEKFQPIFKSSSILVQ